MSTKLTSHTSGYKMVTQNLYHYLGIPNCLIASIGSWKMVIFWKKSNRLVQIFGLMKKIWMINI